MYQTYVCKAHDGVRLTISADLNQFDAPIKIVTEDGEFATDYDTTDAQHNQVNAGMLANAWLLETDAFPAWASSERIAVLPLQGGAV